jgi:hypothetical protein
MKCKTCGLEPIDGKTAAISCDICDTLRLSVQTLGPSCPACADRLHNLAEQLTPVMFAFHDSIRGNDATPILRRVFQRDDFRDMLAAVVEALAARRSVTIPDQEAAAILRGAAQIIRGGLPEVTP